MSFSDLVRSYRLIVILRGLELDAAISIAEAVWAADVGLVEVPVQSAGTLDILRTLVVAGKRRGHPVGAGTVTSAAVVKLVADAGASFTIAPGLDETVVNASVDAGLPHVPGVATASEVQAAERMGCWWLKAFPASTLGTDWFRQMHGPFPNVNFIATGGVSTANAGQFLAAGAQALGIGSAIASPEDLVKLLEVTA